MRPEGFDGVGVNVAAYVLIATMVEKLESNRFVFSPLPA
jgi:hypothetical protein